MILSRRVAPPLALDAQALRLAFSPLLLYLLLLLCINMTIPAMATTTRELFGGAITAKLPKEYLDAR